MKRRIAIQKMMFAMPALMGIPSVFTSCNDTLPDNKAKIIVVGAGAAGIYAAHLLIQQGFDVIVLESSNQIGGRIKALTGFADFPIELGAEEVHGENSVFYEILQNQNTAFVDTDSEDYYFLDGTLSAESALSNDNDLQAAFDLIDNIINFTGNDMTVQAFIEQQNIPHRVVHLLNAQIGNEYGTSNDQIGMQGLAEAEELWTAGNQNFLLQNKSILQVLIQECNQTPFLIKTNTWVTQIDYSGEKVGLIDSLGQTYQADRVLITVPISILRDGDITFSPSLPVQKVEAFHKIGMNTGMKIILKFSERFWAADTGSIYGSGLIPEFWSTGLGRSLQNNILTGFVHGQNAETLQFNDPVSTALAELDAIYGQGVASSKIVNSFVMNWGNQFAIRGTYSYPKPNSAGARDVIAAPLQNKLFFAGEATHTGGHFGTVHGALETAQRAVQEILDSF